MTTKKTTTKKTADVEETKPVVKKKTTAKKAPVKKATTKKKTVTKKVTKKTAAKKPVVKKETFEQWWTKNKKDHENVITLLLRKFDKPFRVDTLRMKYGVKLGPKELAEKVWEEFSV